MRASIPVTIDVMSHTASISPPIHGKRTQHAVDRRIAELAEGQHGVVGRSQLLALGLGRSAIEVRLRRGHLHRIHQGVYAVGHRALTRYGRWMAAVLSGGPEAVLSHRSAAQLWQLLALSSIAVAEKMVNEVEVRGLTDELSVPDLLARYPGRQGTAVLRSIFGQEVRLAGITRSELEDRFIDLLDRTDLPRPRLNADISVRGRFFETDCLWAEQRLIVELDGRAVHGTRRAFERDRERDRLLQAEGWRVVRVTWRQLDSEAPAVIADLRRMLRP